MLTLVLVHGGSVTSRAWDPLLPFLRSPYVTVDLPGRRHRPADLATLRRSDWEAAVAADVEVLIAQGVDGVVLCGHSSGAYVIPGAAASLPDGIVKGMVFVAGTCPAEGLRPVDSMVPKLTAITLANEDHLRARTVGRTIGDLRPGEAPIETDLEIVEVQASMGIEAPEQLFEPMTWVGVPDVAKRYIRALGDRVIPPEQALLMAANAGVHDIVDLEAGHDVAATAPQELARVLDDFVELVT